MSCGIAIYGNVPASLQQQIRKSIESNPKWKPLSPDAYQLFGVPADETYWGDPLAPSMNGVVMLTRRPSPNAPSLEVEYHSMLMQ
jgi:hypothetical protein